MTASGIEIINLVILMVMIRLGASYTALLAVTVFTLALMGTHQMYKFLKQEKSHDGSRD
ncbi:hypothetical protein [Ligilactobacillus acidipiscis]|uniref:hypothetical protein n=1 Tax=Ligilactobacillus acidipiscis TaxID=89059 RepID=UPI00119237B5|nr:hypothetical protein [Ligilactobacillus acidipiscis]GEN19687.1 hypothetical protein LAC02_29680 [Ligilactobacillus acidipiscis]